VTSVNLAQKHAATLEVRSELIKMP